MRCFCSSSYLSAVVEVPVRVHLQLLHLLHLIQHLMHVELRHEKLQATMSISLTAKHGKHFIILYELHYEVRLMQLCQIVLVRHFSKVIFLEKA